MLIIFCHSNGYSGEYGFGMVGKDNEYEIEGNSYVKRDVEDNMALLLSF